MTKELRAILSEAIVNLLEREYMAKGDDFATASEWERITAEPLEYADLVRDLDAYRLLCYVMEADHTMQQAALAAAAAEPHAKVPYGLCPVCGHYGNDCTGELIADSQCPVAEPHPEDCPRHGGQVAMNGMAIIARTKDAIYLRIPPDMQRPIPEGCQCPHCAKDYHATPMWDTLAVPTGASAYAYTVHMPNAAVPEFVAHAKRTGLI